MYVNLFRQFLLWALAVLIAGGCNRRQAPREDEVKAKVPVTVTGIRIADMTTYLDMNATSKFLNKSVVNVPATGYIREVFHNAGDNVSKGEDLLVIQTKEAAALSHDSLTRLDFPGLIRIKATIDGMIVGIDHPNGDFVMEGESWGTISVPSSLVFILEVPFEASSFIELNSACEITLPDGYIVPAKISSRLPSISESTQTQQYIVKPNTIRPIPENLIAKIRIVRKKVPAAITLPSGCILADEVMKHFWVMKLINDSTAVRMDVVTGLTEGNKTEIISPVFSKEDLFLATGNYGLADTVAVRIAGVIKDE
jgi:hypothetical protein